MGGRIDAVGRPGDHGQALAGQFAGQHGGHPPAVVAGGAGTDDRHRRGEAVQVTPAGEKHGAVGNGAEGFGKGGTGAGDQGDIGAGEQVDLALRPLPGRVQLAPVEARPARPVPPAGTTGQLRQRLDRSARLVDQPADEHAAQTGQKGQGQPVLGVRAERQGVPNP